MCLLTVWDPGSLRPLPQDEYDSYAPEVRCDYNKVLAFLRYVEVCKMGIEPTVDAAMRTKRAASALMGLIGWSS